MVVSLISKLKEEEVSADEYEKAENKYNMNLYSVRSIEDINIALKNNNGMDFLIY